MQSEPPAADVSSGAAPSGAPASAASADGTGRTAWDRAAWALFALQLVLLVAGARRVGPTFDEHFYAASGIHYWTSFDLAQNLEHPPLVKLLLGLPLRIAGDPDWSARVPELVAFPRAWFYGLAAERLDRNLLLARLPACLMTVALGLALFRTARRLFSPRAGFLALIAFALSPSVLAHGRLAALDGGLALFLFLAVVALAELLARPGARRLLAAGVAFGLAELAKFTSLLLVPFSLVAAGVACVRGRSWRPLGRVAAAWWLALAVFAAGYGFETRPGDPEAGGLAGRAARFAGERPVPLLTALEGVDYQLEHARTGHPSYFRGEVLEAADFAHGNPYPEYYLVVLAAKTPLATAAVALLGLALCLRPRGAWTVERALCLVGFPVALVAMFSAGNALLGVKYVLPALPFAALWTAAAAERFPRLAAALVVTGALEGAVLLPQAAPAFGHELMYYNALAGGPVGGPETTVVGDDWGQDTRTVGRFYARHAAAIEEAGGLWYDPYSRADPAAFGLERSRRVVPSAPSAPSAPGPSGPPGIVAVHAMDWYRRPQRYAWLADREPFARLGWSVYLFDTRGPAPGGDPLAEWEADGR